MSFELGQFSSSPASSPFASQVRDMSPSELPCVSAPGKMMMIMENLDREVKISPDINVQVVPKRRQRKSGIPVRSLSVNSENGSELMPGLVFRIPFGGKGLDVLKFPTEFDNYATFGRRRAITGVRHRKLTDASSNPANQSDDYQESDYDDDDDQYHATLFYPAFKSSNLTAAGTGPAGYQRRGSRTSASRERQENDSEFDDESDMDVESKPKKKRRGSVSHKKRRARSSADKVCHSCNTTSTPIWREVKEQWGDNWEDVLLCNACGLQWRMSGLRCSLFICASCF